MNKLYMMATILLVAFTAYSQKDTISLKRLSDVDYQQHYDKLKELFLKQLNSEDYKEMADKSDEFYRKSRTDQNRDAVNNSSDEPFSIEKMMAWLEANIEKTDFADFEQVKADYKEMEELRHKVVSDNIEFYEYLAEVSELEPEMFLALINDITLNYPGLFRF